MLSIWTQPSPSDFDRWEQRLLAGEEPSTAAKAEGQTCSAFKRADPTRHAEALAMSRETRAHYADERVEKWVEPDDASDAVKLAWAKRWQPAYAGTQHVEVTGQIEHGGVVTVEHERRLTLADVAAFDRALDGPERGVVRELPSPHTVAEPATG